MNKFLFRAAFFVMMFSLLPVYAQESSAPLAVPTLFSNSEIVQVPTIDCFVGHFNNKINAVFSDIDGTIMPLNKENPHADAPESAKKAVKKLHKAKIPLVLATGRVYPEAKEIAARIGADDTYLIAQQGAEIRNSKGELIYKDGISNSDAKKMLKCLQDFKKANNSTFCILLVLDGKFYSTQKAEVPYIWSEITQLQSFDDLGSDFVPTSICIYEASTEKLKLVQANLKSHFPTYHIDISGPVFCDITSSTATKGNAIKKMAQILGVDLKNVAVFGDAENDISMLKQVKSSGGVSVAVGNAMPSVKESASFVTLPVTQGGFAKAIDEIFINNELLHN